MSNSDNDKYIVRAARRAELGETIVQHQFNENAIRHTTTLGKPTGMERIGVHLVRIEPGHDTTTHHYHDADEEFIYIVSGHGTARIGEDTYDVGPGDFMGFPAPSPAHSMHNPSRLDANGEETAEDLVYLVGGERWATDVVYYPDIGRTMIKSRGQRRWVDDDKLTDVSRKD